MSVWLVKCEPSVYSIDDLKRDKATDWGGVRNYQARNSLMQMKKGEFVLFHHSNADPSGIAGLAKVGSESQPDESQFDKKSDYFDEKAIREKPRWFCPRLTFVEKFTSFLALDSLKLEKKLDGMKLLAKGNRLSVMPVSDAHFRVILKLSNSKIKA